MSETQPTFRWLQSKRIRNVRDFERLTQRIYTWLTSFSFKYCLSESQLLFVHSAPAGVSKRLQPNV